MSLAPPINFQAWIDKNRHLLKPPVGNKVIWKDNEFICMVVGGPNERSDFHYDEGPEFFYQIEGEMVLRVYEEDTLRDIPICAGEIFLLPPRIPHSPQRAADSIGLVIERQRRPGEKDGLMWFCEQCNHKVFEAYFELEDIETQFQEVFTTYYENQLLRTCDQCGYLNPAPAS